MMYSCLAVRDNRDFDWSSVFAKGEEEGVFVAVVAAVLFVAAVPREGGVATKNVAFACVDYSHSRAVAVTHAVEGFGREAVPVGKYNTYTSRACFETRRFARRAGATREMYKT